MEDTQHTQQQQLMSSERPSPEALQQMQQPAMVPYMMPPPMYHPYPFIASHQPLPAMLYPSDPSAMYHTGGPIPDQYSFCYLPAAAYQQVPQVSPQSMAAMQQQQQQQPSQQPMQQQCGLPPVGGPVKPLHMNGYSNYGAYGSMPMNQQLPHHLMPCCCCVQMPFQQQQPPQENGQPQLMQLPSAPESTYIAQSQSYTELYCQQQQQELSETARPEASFEADYQQLAQPQQQQQESPNPGFQKPQHSAMPVMPHSANRRRNGYMHNILYKTELCRDVQDKGVCPRGKTCQFAHSPSELHDPRKHPLYKTAFCFDYKNRGYCPRGPHCFHVHDVSELKTPPIQLPFTPQQPQMQQPQQPMQQLSNVSGGRSNSQASHASPRGARSGRMRRRQSQQHQQQQLLDEAPGPSGERRATAQEATETPFNFLMKKLQQQHQQHKSIETKALGLKDAWTMEPVRVAQ